MAEMHTTRRGLLSAMALAPVVIAAPVIAATGPSKVDAAILRYRHAANYLNSAPKDCSWEEDERRAQLFSAASNQLWDTVPRTAAELSRKAACLWEPGELPNEFGWKVLLRDLQALAA